MTTLLYCRNSSTKTFKETIMGDSQPISWPDLAIGLYDRLTGRQAEISYDFENLHVKIPSDTTSTAQHAEWILDGTIKIRTRDASNDPK
jgi:hypothetical protein